MKKLMILTMALILGSFMIVSNASAAVETLYHDFNTALSPNNFGGECGDMDPDPGSAVETIAVSLNTDASAGANAMKMDYKYAAGSWVGWWSFIASDRSGVDMTGTYTHFSVDAKGTAGGEIFKIEMKDAAAGTDSVVVDPLTTTYQTISNSLGNWSIDFAQLKQVNLVIDSGPVESDIYIDEMKFTGPGGTAIITVTVSQTLAVDVSGSVDLGTVAFKQTVIGSSAITVTNSGSVPEQFYLSQIPAASWDPLSSISPTPGVDEYVLCGVFNTMQPTGPATIKDLNVIAVFPQGASATRYAGDVNGNNVGAGDNRLLWVGFMAPSSTMVSDPQTIILVVTAASPS